MKIVTDNLKNVSKMYSLMQTTAKDNYVGQFVYLDFENEKIKFMNNQAMLTNDLILEDKENHENMLIDGLKFFTLVEMYSSLTVVNDKFISPDGNEFYLPSGSADEFEPFKNDYDDWVDNKISMNEYTINILKNALLYMDQNGTELSALFITNDIAFASDRRKMLFSNFDNQVINDKDFNLPFGLIKLLLLMDYSTNIDCLIKTRTSSSGGKSFMIEHNDTNICYNSSVECKLPVDPCDDDFISTFYHDTNFTIKVSDLAESVKIFNNFFKKETNPVCKWVFETDHINFSVVGNESTDGQIDYKLPISEISDIEYLKDKECYFYFNILKFVLNVCYSLNLEKVLVRFKDEASTIFFGTPVGFEKTSYMVSVLINKDSL